jgi:hypothetical protein
VISIRRCREILAPGVTLSDEQLTRLRDDLYALANAALDVSEEDDQLSVGTDLEI